VDYRSQEAALRARIEEIDGEVEALDRKRLEIEESIATLERETSELERSLSEDGPGKGAVGASILRIPFIVITLLAVAVLLVPFQIYLTGYVHKDPGDTVVPLLLLSGPGLLAALVATPYKSLHRGYAHAVWAGAILVGLIGVLLMIGLTGLVK
jgi:hypothetical protein